MTTPDDGELYSECMDSLRTRLAMQFAAAWLPIVNAVFEKDGWDIVMGFANEQALAMADDLIRRLKVIDL